MYLCFTVSVRTILFANTIKPPCAYLSLLRYATQLSILNLCNLYIINRIQTKKNNEKLATLNGILPLQNLIKRFEKSDTILYKPKLLIYQLATITDKPIYLL